MGRSLKTLMHEANPLCSCTGAAPSLGGLCKGVEEAMASMRAGQLSYMMLTTSHAACYQRMQKVKASRACVH